MLANPQFKEDLILLVQAQEWHAIRSWFGHWDNEDEMIDKVMLWGHFFWHEYFRDPSPDFHRELIRRFFSPKDEYTAAPRGFSKTTIIQLCIAFSIANNLDKFIVVIEKTFDEAAEVMKGVYDEFLTNENILAVYGQLISAHEQKHERRHGITKVRERDARGDTFINGIRLRGKGFNKTIRGLKSKSWRPTRIILDDIEEDEHINNPEQREKYSNNYRKGILPAADVTGHVKMFGTILHQDSLLNNQIENHGGVIYKAHQGDDPATAPADSFLWPERWSRERLMKKKKDMMSKGQSSNAYVQEYLNNPISEEDRRFKFQWLWEMIPKPDNHKERYRVPAKRITMQEFEELRKKTVLSGFAMIDVADSTKSDADFTGAVVHFVDTNNNRYRVHCAREKRNIKGVIDLVFELWEKWAPYGLIKIGIEKKGYEDQIVPLFEEEKRRRQAYPIIEELKPMGRNKENRIQGALEGFYEMGKIISVCRVTEDGYIKPVGDTDTILEELYNFPSAKHDDLSDAEAYSADIVIVPLNDEKTPSAHHQPQDDPFEHDNNYDQSFVSHIDDDPY